MERLLTIPEVMERLRVARSTVYALMAAGDLPSIALGGTRTRRVRESDLDAWIRRQVSECAVTATLGAPEISRGDS